MMMMQLCTDADAAFSCLCWSTCISH